MTRSARGTDGPNAAPLTLLVGYDFSAQAELALDEAVTLAATAGPAVLHVLGVLGHGGHGIGDTRPLHHIRFGEAAAMQDKISTMVEAALARRGQAGVRAFVHSRIGAPADVILALAREVAADLIIVGTHGRQGIERLLIGSVAEKVVRGASCPVLTMRPTRYDEAPAADDDLAPEPPCPACVSHRADTGGAEWWCSAHSKAWVPPSRYAYTDSGISRLRPDEWVLW